jgi:hypothetical protein
MPNSECYPFSDDEPDSEVVAEPKQIVLRTGQTAGSSKWVSNSF